MKTKNILFIVEGENDEPNFIRQMLSKCFAEVNFEIYSYKTNVHTLSRILERDYPDFDEDEIDIQMVLASYENDVQSRDILTQKYTDVFLIFDFDPQDSIFNKKMLRRMIAYFNRSDDHGKLFVNYPMMQSYRHLKDLPDISFYDLSIQSSNYLKYKEIVNEYSKHNDLRKFSYVTFVSIAIHHLLKAFKVQGISNPNLNVEEFDKLDYLKIYDKECECNDNGYIFVLNTCIFILIDYRPLFFFTQISTHSDTYYY